MKLLKVYIVACLTLSALCSLNTHAAFDPFSGSDWENLGSDIGDFASEAVGWAAYVDPTGLSQWASLVADPIKDAWEGKRDVGYALQAGSDMLQKAPGEFKKGLEQLKKMPQQFRAGAQQVQPALEQVVSAGQQTKQQFTDLQGKNLASMGLSKFEQPLKEALTLVIQAMKKLANTDANKQCIAGADGGILCELKATLLQSADFAEQQVKIIEKQILELEQKINHADISGRPLYQRMYDLGVTLAV